MQLNLMWVLYFSIHVNAFSITPLIRLFLQKSIIIFKKLWFLFETAFANAITIKGGFLFFIVMRNQCIYYH